MADSKDYLFARLSKQLPPYPDKVANALLASVEEGDYRAIGPLADRLNELGDTRYRKLVSLAGRSARKGIFCKLRADINNTVWWRPYDRRLSILALTDRRLCRIAIDLFPKTLYPGKSVVLAINDFTRTKMREDGFYRRIMPTLLGDELETDLPEPL